MGALFPQDILNSIDLFFQSQFQGSTEIYVDGNRSDIYTPDGSSFRPYKTITSALASIVGSGSTNPFTVRISSGIYVEAPLNVPSYVKLVGSGWLNTRLEASDLNNHFITLAPGCVIREVGIAGPTAAMQAAIHCGTSDPRAIAIKEVTISRGYYGILADPAISVVPILIQNVSFGYTGLGSAVNTLIHGTGFASLFVIDTLASGPADTIGTAYSVVGADAKMRLITSYHECAGTTTAAYVDDGAILATQGCIFSSGQTAYHVGNSGASTLDVEACKIHRNVGGGYTNDFLLESAASEVSLSGTFSRDRIVNTGGCLIDASFHNRETGQEGQTIVGELNLAIRRWNSKHS